MGLGRKDQKIAAPLPRSESRESNAAPPFEYRHATTTHMNCQLQGGCESREQRVELDERRASAAPLRQILRYWGLGQIRLMHPTSRSTPH